MSSKRRTRYEKLKINKLHDVNDSLRFRRAICDIHLRAGKVLNGNLTEILRHHLQHFLEDNHLPLRIAMRIENSRTVDMKSVRDSMTEKLKVHMNPERDYHHLLHFARPSMIQEEGRLRPNIAHTTMTREILTLILATTNMHKRQEGLMDVQYPDHLIGLEADRTSNHSKGQSHGRSRDQNRSLLKKLKRSNQNQCRKLKAATIFYRVILNLLTLRSQK
jgi:hypothetical protein